MTGHRLYVQRVAAVQVTDGDAESIDGRLSHRSMITGINRRCELAEAVRKMPKLDWTQRESVRADLRRSVRRLLARFGYPPDLSEDATQLVLKQAERATENELV